MACVYVVCKIDPCNFKVGVIFLTHSVKDGGSQQTRFRNIASIESTYRTPWGIILVYQIWLLMVENCQRCMIRTYVTRRLKMQIGKSNEIYK